MTTVFCQRDRPQRGATQNNHRLLLLLQSRNAGLRALTQKAQSRPLIKCLCAATECLWLQFLQCVLHHRRQSDLVCGLFAKLSLLNCPQSKSVKDITLIGCSTQELPVQEEKVEKRKGKLFEAVRLFPMGFFHLLFWPCPVKPCCADLLCQFYRALLSQATPGMDTHVCAGDERDIPF